MRGQHDTAARPPPSLRKRHERLIDITSGSDLRGNKCRKLIMRGLLITIADTLLQPLSPLNTAAIHQPAGQRLQLVRRNLSRLQLPRQCKCDADDRIERWLIEDLHTQGT
jgi:hypothetical protein